MSAMMGNVKKLLPGKKNKRRLLQEEATGTADGNSTAIEPEEEENSEATLDKYNEFGRLIGLSIDGKVFVYDTQENKSIYQIKSAMAGRIGGQGDKQVM